jgi:prepilin signal peptidase PulO-like enzyme (type II secretory pathway)
MLALFAVIGLTVSYTDIKRGLVSRYPVLLSIGAALAANLIFTRELFLPSLLGCASGLGAFALARAITGGGLGLGDVWFSGLVGAFFGPVIWALSIAIATASAGIWMLASRRKKAPFVPFLFLGSFACATLFSVYAKANPFLPGIFI